MNLYKPSWEDTKERFKAWWKASSISGRPMLWIVAKNERPEAELEQVSFSSPEDRCLNVEKNIKRMRNYCSSHLYMAESFPCMDMNIGCSMMLAYLGVEMEFRWDTVWYKECVSDWNKVQPLCFDENSHWWNVHLDMIRQAVKMANGDFYINVPDFLENMDILSGLRGPQNLCYDIMDDPDTIKGIVRQVNRLYFEYYDRMYDIVKDSRGGNSALFNVWGPGRTQKLQCDFSALMSPGQFRDIVQPSLALQCENFHNALYHLDGPDAIKHLDAVIEIDGIDALQWTPGVGQPDGSNEKWYPIYDKVRKAGKALWIQLYDGSTTEQKDAAKKLISRYGPDGLLLIFPEMNINDANDLMESLQ